MLKKICGYILTVIILVALLYEKTIWLLMLSNLIALLYWFDD